MTGTSPSASSHASAHDQLKQQAADAALSHVDSGMCVGLGSGSTAARFIAALGQRLASGKLRYIRAIPTSEASRALAESAGIPLTSFGESAQCDLTVDGADEIDPRLNLIKGLGGALLREKVVAQNSRMLIIIADAGKLVDRLGTRGPLPVEVMRFGMERQSAFFRSLGGEPTLRLDEKAGPYVTDSGNHIYDIAFGPIGDPHELEIKLLRRAGIVQTGLFLDMADEVIIAHPDRLQRMSRA